MAEHQYAQVLRWIADGEKIQYKCATGVWVEEHPDITLNRISNGTAHEYRLAPTTIRIGDLECEAPILNRPSCRGELWYVRANGLPEALEGCTTEYVQEVISNGRAFATREAAIAAHVAITKLLKASQ